LLKEGLVEVKNAPQNVDALKQRVFDDLTKNKKLYVTDALKFGGHFLVYQGDPDLFHAKYIVVVAPEGKLDACNFSAFSRSANSAKKNLLLAIVCEEEV
jgi:tRNA splicing endonuclease